MSNTNHNGKVVLTLSFLAVGLAGAAAVVLMLAGVGSRLGWWHFRTGFALLSYGAYGGIAAAALAVVSGVMAIHARRTGAIVLSAAALIGGLAVMAVPLSWRLKAKELPKIHDITTDTVNPPQFVAILPLRRMAPNPAGYGGQGVADEQKRGYPDLHSEVLDVPVPQAYERALSAARAMGWRVVASDPEQGCIEASDTTRWFGFVDDIVVRIVAAGQQRSVVDVRSVSRVGKSDVGTNAARIRKYLLRLRS